MTIWLEMHATSVDNEAQIASGWYDAELSTLGEQQARELGERRRHTDFAAVYCSDLERSYHTADIAFAGSQVHIVRDRRLRECDYGDLTRHPVSEIDARRLAAIRVPFPNGESYEAVTRRVHAWLTEAAERHGGQSVLVIGHRATFYALEHLCSAVPLVDVIAAPWQWQPGWRYQM
jgi:broad specificity phosphatase PhoE